MEHIGSRVKRQVDEPPRAIKNCICTLEQVAADKGPIMFRERVRVLAINDRLAKPQRHRLHRKVIPHGIDDSVERSVDRSSQCNFSVNLVWGTDLVEKEYFLQQRVF